MGALPRPDERSTNVATDTLSTADGYLLQAQKAEQAEAYKAALERELGFETGKVPVDDDRVAAIKAELASVGGVESRPAKTASDKA